MDPNMDAQFCTTHQCSAADCWVYQPMDYKPTIKAENQKTPDNRAMILVFYFILQLTEKS